LYEHKHYVCVVSGMVNVIKLELSIYYCRMRCVMVLHIIMCVCVCSACVQCMSVYL